MTTITKAESRRRERLNRDLFPVGLIDQHNEAGKNCECCKRPETAGDCFEDDDRAHVCVRCYWTRTDRLPTRATK